MAKKLTTEEFVKNAKEVHGDEYDYSKTLYKGRTCKVIIICPEHGEFEQRPANHVSNKRGCPKCGNSRTGLSKKASRESFIEKAREIHGDIYNYSKVVYKSTNDKVDIVCNKHGVFSQTPNSHLQNHGCPKCGFISTIEKQSRTKEDFLKKVNELYEGEYEYQINGLLSNSSYIDIKCKKHGLFRKTVKNHLKKQGCPKCKNKASKSEKDIYKFIKDRVYSEQFNRSILDGQELDIYIPSKNIAIEFNGLYWHSDKFKTNSYHVNKTKKCLSNGVRLIQIFEDEWEYKKDIVKSRLLNFLSITPVRMFARKLTIAEVPTPDAMIFLDENHIQGKVGAAVKLGLYHEDELVSLMTFGRLRKNLGQSHKEGSWELLRFCNKLNTTVVGGASKLLKFFEKSCKPIDVVSYADLRWSQGNLYEKLGFDKIHEAYPNYFYISRSAPKTRETRFKYRKSILVKEGFDASKSEREIMRERGFNRIYDCGTIKFYKKFCY